MPASSQPPRTAFTPHLALYQEQATHDALLEGRLIMRGGCLFVVGKDGTTYGVAWPSNRTHWDTAASEIVVGDSHARVGQVVFVGGGPVRVTAANLADSVWRWAEAPRVECLSDDFFFASSIRHEAP